MRKYSGLAGKVVGTLPFRPDGTPLRVREVSLTGPLQLGQKVHIIEIP